MEKLCLFEEHHYRAFSTLYAFDVRFDRIVADDAVMGGVPCLRGTRIPVVTVIGMFAAGLDVPAILADYPELTEADLRAALEFAVTVIDDLPPAVRSSV